MKRIYTLFNHKIRMNQHNQEIQKFLSYYYSLPIAPEYAVMLKGNWGSGKTWFIRKSLENFRSYGGKALYVSLYGISSQEQIEQDFFRQLHPILGSKGASLAGKLFKGLVKGTLKIDIIGDARDDGTAAIGVPDINIPEYLRNTNGIVLVFDDLERCSLPISDLLGYINQLVEHDGYKVVVLANEEEILSREVKSETKQEYARIKEKLIGKSFETKPELESAITHFLNEIEEGYQRRILHENTLLIQQLHTASGYKNLRHLRQAMLDYARLLEILGPEIRKNSDVLTHLLKMFFIYSFEIKSGFLQPDGIERMRIAASSSNEQKSDEQKAKFNSIARKYIGINLFDSLLPNSAWKDIFETGLFNETEIKQAIRNSRYFISESKPDWVRIWNAHSLPDNVLEQLLSEVSKRFAKNEYTQIGVFRHIVGTLLMLSEIKIFRDSKDKILETAYSNIEKMKHNGTLRKEFESGVDFMRSTGFGGLAYHQSESDEFREFTNRLALQGQEAIEQGYPEKAAEILSLMKSDTSKFCRALVLTNEQNNLRYYSVPILKYIQEKEFIDAIEQLKSDQLDLVNGAIIERYSAEYSIKSLQQELPWLEAVTERLKRLKDERAGKMSGVFLQQLEKNLVVAIKNLRASLESKF